MQDNRLILLGGSSQVAISASVLSIGEVSQALSLGR